MTQKTAVFGMTRTGKSNTMKIIAKSIYDLRKTDDALRIGQIVFDSNGEYANENVQDGSALKNIWKTIDNSRREDEIATYGIVPHPNDDGRNLMRLDFYREGNLQVGKQIIDDLMADQTSQYAKAFRNVAFYPPAADDYSETTRYKRRVLCYHALLYRAGFESTGKPVVSKLFGKAFLAAMKNAEAEDKFDYSRCAEILGSNGSSWLQLSHQMEILRAFLDTDDYNAFNRDRARKGHGEPWADVDLEKILDMFQSPNRPRTYLKNGVA